MRVHVEVDEEACKRIASALKGLSFTPDPFTDPRLYPPLGDPEEHVLRYFTAMVSIDHRTGTPERKFKAFVDGRLYSGAYLLYRLGMVKYMEDPDFFSPQRLASLTVDEVRHWLTVRSPEGTLTTARGCKVRALLLKDLGVKLLKLYDGVVGKLIEESEGYVKRLGEGLVDRLKVFLAYQDPVEKKAYLLVKFLERRGLFKPVDPENLEVPVDNRLVRIAIRTGLVRLYGVLRERVVKWEEVSWEEDIVIRLAVRRAFKEVSRLAGIKPTILDDLLWLIGAYWCKWERPLCDRGAYVEELKALYQSCPLRPSCAYASSPKTMPLREHRYYDTWYY